MAVIRIVLGALILFLNWVFTPRGLKRDLIAQAEVDAQTANLTLYHYKACPFCVKVRRTMKRLSLNIETRDAKRDEQAREELVAATGMLKVPCLKIQDESGERWMFESKDIIAYLEGRFSEGIEVEAVTE